MNNISERIRTDLLEMQDMEYKEFHGKLIPNVENNTIIGIRTPKLRSYAKYVFENMDYEQFLNDLPHKYYDENNLHMFIICRIRNYNECLGYLEAFLPYIDNWATCDVGAPRVFAGHKGELFDRIRVWLKSGDTYTIRYGINMLMRLYLDEDFKTEYADMVAEVRSSQYYVNMMIAWYFATALAKQYDSIIPYIEEGRLDRWTHNKTIQKARESLRITPMQKDYLKNLKM